MNLREYHWRKEVKVAHLQFTTDLAGWIKYKTLAWQLDKIQNCSSVHLQLNYISPFFTFFWHLHLKGNHI